MDSISSNQKKPTVLFIQNSQFEALGIECLSALLKKEGFDTGLFIYDNNALDLLEYIKARPNIFLLGFQIFSYQHNWAVELMKKLKSEIKIPIVIGGGHPTFFPEESIKMEGVDYSVRGEGEYPLLNLCRALVAGRKGHEIKSVWAKLEDGSIVRNEMDDLPDNLDELPFPDRTIYENTLFFNNFPVKRFLTRRGCPYNCSFCFNKQYREITRGKGRYVRLRTPDNVIEEILQVKAKYGMKTVAFTDDDFTSNKEWSFEFLEKYKNKINLPFTAFGKAAELDEEMARILKDAGCHMFAFGVESGDERMRNEVLRKNLTNEQIFKAVKIFHKYDINFMTFNMVGNPGESFDDAVRTLKFNVSLKPKVSSSTVLNPYVETDLYNYCLKHGYIDQTTKDQLKEQADLFGYAVFLKQPDMDKIVNLEKVFTMLVKFPVLIKPTVWLIKHNLLPRPLLSLCYKTFSALRQKDKLRLNWREFVYFGIKLRKQSY